MSSKPSDTEYLEHHHRIHELVENSRVKFEDPDEQAVEDFR